MPNTSNSLLGAVKFNEKGLVHATTQDRRTCRILVVAWMNIEALREAVKTGFAHYYSRSCQRRWMKGEESRHTQGVYELRLDYDGDAIVVLIDQNDGIACRMGRESCFYKIRKDGTWQTVDAVLKDEETIYGRTHSQRSPKSERSELRQNE